ncbi:MAG: redoxin domain-containing protein [Chloroflexi bacterium]|nr:redoxin domain-containing protein [Chloroflexota bacterium]
MGDVAPDFELRDINGENPVHLSDLNGKKPVALIFGSFT